MRIARQNRWDLPVEEALCLQRRLAAAVDTSARLGRVRLVAGADAAYHPDGERLVAAVVVVALQGLEVVEEATARASPTPAASASPVISATASTCRPSAAPRRLAGEHGAVGAGRGSWSWLRDGRERLGVALRTRDGVRPVYVSPGYAIGLRDARALVLRTCAGYRLPEPTRRANLLVNALRRGELTPRPPGPASGRAAPASGP